MERRNFLKSLLAFFSATAFFSFLYPLMRLFAYHARKPEMKKVVLKKREMPEGGSMSFVFNDAPAIIIDRTDKGLVALSKVCTHLGCLLEYDRDRKGLFCPCHAGVYDLEGNVVSGPPQRPLTRLPLSAEGDNIIVG